MVGNYWQLLTAITGREVIGSYVPFEKRAWNSLGRWATRKEAAAEGCCWCGGKFAQGCQQICLNSFSLDVIPIAPSVGLDVRL